MHFSSLAMKFRNQYQKITSQITWYYCSEWKLFDRRSSFLSDFPILSLRDSIENVAFSRQQHGTATFESGLQIFCIRKTQHRLYLCFGFVQQNPHTNYYDRNIQSVKRIISYQCKKIIIATTNKTP